MEKVLLHKQKHLFVVRGSFGVWRSGTQIPFLDVHRTQAGRRYGGPYDPRTTTYDERLFHDFLDGGYDVFSRETEFLEQCACRSGCTEGFHGNRRAVEADVFAPAEVRSGFDSDAGADGFREDLFFIGFVLLFKEFQAGHADDTDVDTFFSQFVFGVDG